MIEILRAQPEDADALKKIAIAAKGHWGYDEPLMAQWAQTPIITPEAIAADCVYKGCDGVSIIAWHRLLTSVPTAILDDLWVLPTWIGHGIGRRLFQHAIAQAQLAGALAIELDADPNAAPFYARMGCQMIGESWTEWGRTIPRMRYTLPANIARRA
ncbi:MAG: GNAT family N-acetyltransferase [Chloroflexi bacterium]|nr:GNAT family N-acetyltransferase [Chloroflexota bacterium]